MYGSQGLEIVLQVFLLAFILRRVDEAAYGVFVLAMGLQYMLYAIRDAITKGCITYGARYWQEGNPEGINKVVSSASAVLVIPGVVALITLVTAAGPISRFLNVAPEMQQTTCHILILLGVNISVVLPLSPLVSLVSARQRYDLVALVRGASRLLYAGMVVAAFLILRPDVLFVAVASVLADLGRLVVLGIIAHRLVPSLRIRPRFVQRASLSALLVFGSFLIYGGLARIGVREAIKWFVGKTLGLSFVTFLLVAVILMNLLKRACGTMTLVIVPVASRYKALGDQTRLGELLVRSTRYVSLVTVPIVASLAPAMGPLFALWLKPELAWVGPYSMVVGMCAAICLPAEAAAQIVIGMGDSKRPFVATAAGALLGLAATALTVGFLGWGLSGAILGICVSLVVMAIGYTWCALGQIEVRSRRLLWEAYLQPIVAAIPAAAVCTVLRYFLVLDTWPALIAACAAAGATYVIAFLPFVTRAEWGLARRALAWRPWKPTGGDLL